MTGEFCDNACSGRAAGFTRAEIFTRCHKPDGLSVFLNSGSSTSEKELCVGLSKVYRGILFLSIRKKAMAAHIMINALGRVSWRSSKL
jgi:hypothetical protein